MSGTRSVQNTPIASALDPSGWLLMVPGSDGALERVPTSMVPKSGTSLALVVGSITFPDGSTVYTATAMTGPTGLAGATGPAGATGATVATGAAGVGITSVTMNGSGQFVFTLSNGVTITA